MLRRRDADLGKGKGLAGHAEVQVPAWWPPAGALDRAATMPGIAGRDDAVGLQPVQAGAHCALGQPGVADQRGRRRERGGALSSAADSWAVCQVSSL